jgi:hypothetical protein
MYGVLSQNTSRTLFLGSTLHVCLQTLCMDVDHAAADQDSARGTDHYNVVSATTSSALRRGPHGIHIGIPTARQVCRPDQQGQTETSVREFSSRRALNSARYVQAFTRGPNVTGQQHATPVAQPWEGATLK